MKPIEMTSWRAFWKKHWESIGLFAVWFMTEHDDPNPLKYFQTPVFVVLFLVILAPLSLIFWRPRPISKPILLTWLVIFMLDITICSFMFRGQGLLYLGGWALYLALTFAFCADLFTVIRNTNRLKLRLQPEDGQQ